MSLLARVDPQELLGDHLKGVSMLAAKYAPNHLKEMARLSGLTHDIGKATTYFQQHLKNPNYRATKTHHSYLSAVFGAWVAQQRGLDGFPIFVAIARHHGNLKTPLDLLPSKIEPPNFLSIKGSLGEELRALQVQIHDLKNNGEFKNLSKELDLPDPKPFLERGVWRTLKSLYNEARNYYLNSNTREKYWVINLLFSCLIDADKKLAAQVNVPQRKSMPHDLVDRYIVTVRKQANASPEILNLRYQLYTKTNEMVSKMRENSIFGGQFTITAPTGSGKTLTGFNVALKLRERIRREQGVEPRIIYALPYINIIEQNYNVIKDVFCKNRLNPDDYVIPHHHLALTAFSEDANEDKNIEDKLMLMESWDSEIIVTTFIQLFQTLVGAKNRFLKKLHNIRGSIVILDEIQSIKAEYWPIIRCILEDLKHIQATVISMTATQPELVRGQELAPKFTDLPKRVQIDYQHEVNLDTLANDVKNSNAKSKLIVLNTIPESAKLYRALKKDGVSQLYYLSTNITPYERKHRIEEIKQKIERGENITLVSTQVIEAGVDLDFSEGWREIGPLDSIVQIAGRINRNAKNKGHLHVFNLQGDDSFPVYGRILPDLAKKVVPNIKDDLELISNLQEYYKEVENRISTEESKSILEAIDSLNYNIVNEFSLIDEPSSVSIFVELDGASEILEKFKDALLESDVTVRRLKLRRLRPKLEMFMINTYESRVKQNLPPRLFYDDPKVCQNDIFYIPKSELSVYYELNGIGFKFLSEDVLESQFVG